MKIQIEKKELVDGLNIASNFLGRNYDINEFFKITTYKNEVLIEACNYIYGCKVKVPATIIKQGSVVVGKKLHATTNLMKNGTLSLENKRGKLLLSGGRDKFYISVMSDGVDKFPFVPVPEGEGMEIKRDTLVDALKKIEFAVNNPSVKIKDFTTMFAIDKGKAYGTNRYICSSIPLDIDEQFLLPKDSMKTIKLLDSNIKVSCEGDMIFTYDDMTLMMFKIPKVLYPYDSVSQVFEKNYNQLAKMSFNKQELKEFNRNLDKTQVIQPLVSILVNNEGIYMMANTNDPELDSLSFIFQEKKNIELSEIVLCTFNISYLKGAIRRCNEVAMFFMENTLFIRSDKETIILPIINNKEELLREEVSKRGVGA